MYQPIIDKKEMPNKTNQIRIIIITAIDLIFFFY